jgi:hypothetical protein
MIGPKSMDELNSEIGNPSLKSDIFNQNKEALIIEDDYNYEEVQGMAYEENNESNIDFMSKKKSGQSTSNDINSAILFEKDNYDNDFKEYNEYNDHQDYEETSPVEEDQHSKDIPQ